MYIFNKNLQRVFSAVSLYLLLTDLFQSEEYHFLCGLKILTVYLLISDGSKAQSDTKNISEKAPYFRGGNL